MKLLKYQSITILIICLLSGACFTSCGSDDNDENDNSAPSISSNTGSFVGLWSIRGSSTATEAYPYYEAFFFQDNKCKVKQSYSTNFTHEKVTENSWSFDNTSKRFVIEGIANAQWEVTAQSEN